LCDGHLIDICVVQACACISSLEVEALILCTIMVLS